MFYYETGIREMWESVTIDRVFIWCDYRQRDYRQGLTVYGGVTIYKFSLKSLNIKNLKVGDYKERE